MDKSKKWGISLQQLTMVGIALYLLMYMVVFYIFDVRKATPEGDDMEVAVRFGILGAGVGIICAIISFLIVSYAKNKYVRNIVLLCVTLVQFVISCALIDVFGLGSTGNSSYYFQQDGVDFYRRIIVSAVVIGIYALIQLVYTLISIRNSEEKSEHKKETTKKSATYIVLMIINDVMAIALLMININYFLRLNDIENMTMIFSEVFLKPEMVAKLLFDTLIAGLPFFLLLILIVNRCIGAKRYGLVGIIYGASAVAFRNAMYFYCYHEFDQWGEYKLVEDYILLLIIVAVIYMLAGASRIIIKRYLSKKKEKN